MFLEIKSEMKGLIFCSVCAVVMLTTAKGQEEEAIQLRESEPIEPEPLKCFRCDLGFWDACFTTKMNCSAGERCYTGRGKAADALDVKMLGCVRAEECGVMATVEIFPKTTIYTMTKYCCDEDLCNTAHTRPLNTPLTLAVVSLSTMLLTAPCLGLQ